MTVTVNMSKEEFLDYCKEKDFKTQIKCSIMELDKAINKLSELLMKDGILDDNNKYDKVMKLFITIASDLEGKVQ